MNICSVIGHKWLKWSEPYNKFVITEVNRGTGKKIATHTDTRQRRMCERCNKMEEREL